MIASNFDISKPIFEGLKSRAQSAVLKDKSRELTGLEVIDLINYVSNLLSNKGLAAGDRVLLVNDGDVFFPIFYTSIVRPRGVVVPCPTGSNVRFGEQYLSKRAQPKFIIASKDYDNLTGVNINGTPYYLYSLSNKTNKMSLTLNEIGVASLMFTSGTTGEPKGVLVSHENLCSTLQKNIDFQNLSKTTIELNTLPLTHSFGLGQLNATLAAGGLAIVLPGLANVGQFFKMAKSNKVTSLPMTPAGLKILTDRYLGVFSEHFESLETIMVNSAPLPPDISRTLLELLPKTRLLVYYGLTEASRSTFAELNSHDQSLLISVGKPIGDTSIYLSKKNSEIVVSGSNVSPGYFHDCETPIQKHTGGNLPTGDKGKLDDKGRLVVVGRLFDELNIGGYKIDPLEVERLVLELNAVNQACYTKIDGIADIAETVLFIQASETMDVMNVRAFLREKLEGYKLPSHIFQIAEIPIFDSGKINRKEAKILAKEFLN